jgi:hypothetical protein
VSLTPPSTTPPSLTCSLANILDGVSCLSIDAARPFLALLSRITRTSRRTKAGRSAGSNLRTSIIPSYLLVDILSVSRLVFFARSLLCRCFDPWEEVERRERAFLDGQGPRTPDLVVPSLNPSTEERTRGRKVGELAPSDPIGRRGSEPDASRGKMTRG